MTPTAATSGVQLDKENPWPGLDSYDERSQAFFSGREDEIDELCRRILDESTTVLFGKSGLGKSSLLRAGVSPRLKDKGLLPVFIRLQHRDDAESLIEQVRLTLIQQLEALDIDCPRPTAGETLWEYLHREGLEFWTTDNRPVRPLLVFDQFEEIFTLGRTRPEAVLAFREELADLIENRIPAPTAARLEHTSAADTGIDMRTMPYKAVLSLREDFLADLEEWRTHMPSLRRNRMRLLPMTRKQATQAVYNPQTAHLVSHELAASIVDYLSSAGTTQLATRQGTDDSVEPALLSLFCREVNEQRKALGKGQFDRDLVEGAKGTIVSNFYRSSVADLPDRVRRFIEAQLITEQGFRNTYAVADATALGTVTATELDTLINRHVLRHEHHLGTDRVELTHDLLTTAVLQERERRREDQREALFQTTRRARRRRQAVAILAGSAAVFGLAVYANGARQASHVSRSRELAALSKQVLNQDADLAVLLAREGLATADTSEARDSLDDALRYAWPNAHFTQQDLGGAPIALAVSADGGRLAVLSDPSKDGSHPEAKSVALWDVTRRTPGRPLWSQSVSGEASSLIYSPDGRLLAVADPTSVVMLDVVTGRPDMSIARILDEHLDHLWVDRRVAFSPDGKWFGSASSDDHIRLIDYHTGRTLPAAPAPGMMQFVVGDGARRIFFITSGLEPHALELQNDSWKEIPSEWPECNRTSNLSISQWVISRTYTGNVCARGTFDDRGAIGFEGLESTDAAEVDDIVWSSQGRGYLMLLTSEDMVGGQWNSPPFRIKGAHPKHDESDKTRFMSISEAATTVALIDEEAAVRVYWTGIHKPFYSGLRGAAVLPEPGRIAAPSPDGGPPGLDIISWSPNALDFPTVNRVALPAQPASLLAAADAIVAGAGRLSDLVDWRTGAKRGDGFEGRPVLFNDALLLITPDPIPLGSAGALRAIRLRDGADVPLHHRAEFRNEFGRRAALIVSPGRRAFAVVSPLPGGPIDPRGSIDGPWTVDSYVSHGENIEFVAQMTRSTLRWPLVLSDDGKQITESADGVIIVSPLGRFAIHREERDHVEEYRLTRADGSNLRLFERMRLPDFAFSEDDRWLAVRDRLGDGTNEMRRVQVLDLVRNRFSFSLVDRDITNARFGPASGLLEVGLRNRDVLVVPVENALLMRFAAWLVPRSLTEQERCTYGFGNRGCNDSLRTVTFHPTGKS